MISSTNKLVETIVPTVGILQLNQIKSIQLSIDVELDSQATPRARVAGCRLRPTLSATGHLRRPRGFVPDGRAGRKDES